MLGGTGWGSTFGIMRDLSNSKWLRLSTSCDMLLEVSSFRVTCCHRIVLVSSSLCRSSSESQSLSDMTLVWSSFHILFKLPRNADLGFQRIRVIRPIQTIGITGLHRYQVLNKTGHMRQPGIRWRKKQNAVIRSSNPVQVP